MTTLSALTLMVLLAACDPITITTRTTTTLIDLPPPDLSSSSATSTTTTAAPSVTTTDPSPYTYRGYLPNGTDFRVVAPGSRQESMTLVQGAFFFQSDGGLLPVGEVRYARVGSPVANAYDSGILKLNAGEWVVDVLFNDDVLDALRGEELAESVVTTGIELEEEDGWPVIRLTSPFTWGYAGAVPPAVRYESFVIEPGCTENAVTCTGNRAIQVLALADRFPGSPEMSQQRRNNTFIETLAARSPLDPNYLDAGPLDPRLSADLIWTGEEMIVWGGKQARDGLTTLVDGAAFNPATDEWRLIAPFPLQGPQATRAVWGNGEMIVVSANGTFGYDSESDSWRTIGNGVVPSEWHDRMLYLDGRLYLWVGTRQIHELTVDTGEWRILEAPGPTSSSGDPYFSAIRGVNGHLVAITLDGGVCFGKHFWQLDGNTWEALPDFSLATSEYSDCSTANQSASVGNRLVIWDEELHPSAAYSPTSGQWRELPPIPIGGMEGPTGPVPMGTDHFLVPRWGDAAIFDATSGEWARVILPGQGSDAEMIWTGEEILAWGVWETFESADAWRWTPGQTLIGGDDAT